MCIYLISLIHICLILIFKGNKFSIFHTAIQIHMHRTEDIGYREKTLSSDTAIAKIEQGS